MNYMVRMDDGTERRVSFRDHNTPHIKLGGQWVRIWFNIYEADEREVECEVRIAKQCGAPAPERKVYSKITTNQKINERAFLYGHHIWLRNPDNGRMIQTEYNYNDESEQIQFNLYLRGYHPVRTTLSRFDALHWLYSE